MQAVQMPDGPTSDSGLKMEVLKARELFCLLRKHCAFCFGDNSVLNLFLTFLIGSNCPCKELS